MTSDLEMKNGYAMCSRLWNSRTNNEKVFVYIK